METGACYLDDEGRKEVLMAYQARKQEELSHPFLGENCDRAPSVCASGPAGPDDTEETLAPTRPSSRGEP